MANGQPTHNHLEQVIAGISLLADLHRGDVLVYVPSGNGKVQVVAHAQPHSMPSVYPQIIENSSFRLDELPAVAQVQEGLFAAQGPRSSAAHRAHIVQNAFAIKVKGNATPLGVLTIEKSLVEDERHRTRRRQFRYALHNLRERVIAGQTDDLRDLPPFLESDGILVVDSHGIITYVSGVGSYLYRRIGYSSELAGTPVAQQTPIDAELAERAGIPVRLVDERLSTASASRAMREAGRSAKAQRQSIDQAAAVVILDTALDAARRGNLGTVATKVALEEKHD